MLRDIEAFSGFSVDDAERAREFYTETLGLEADEPQGPGFRLKLGSGATVFVYAKGEAHRPASFTVLNFPVDDIESTVDGLVERGVEFERYDDFEHDERGIARGGPVRIAWFTDPAGNVISVMQEA